MHEDQNLRDLFERFRRDGDADALGTLFDELGPKLLRLAQCLARNQTEAEDLLQATFVKAIEARDQYDPEQPLTPWLSGILGNQWRASRRAARRRPDARRLRRNAPRDPSATAMDTEVRSRITGALRQLPAKYAAVIEPYLLQDRAPKEIAEELRRAPGTVRMQISRGLDLLRGALPAGLASAGTATVVSASSLAAIRAEVLRAGRRRLALSGTVPAAGLASWWTFIGSHKLALATVLLAIVASWWAVSLSHSSPAAVAQTKTARSADATPSEDPDLPVERAAVTAPDPSEAPAARTSGGSSAPTPIPEGTVSATVVAWDTEVPIPGAEVRFLDLDTLGRDLERESTLRRGDPDDFYRDHGLVYRADDAGRLKLPAAKRAALWVARDGAAAELRTATTPEAPVRIALRPARSLQVRVLDAQGHPAAGVPVIARIDGRTGRQSWTDARGLAKLPRIARLLEGRTRCEVTANLALRKPCEQSLTLTAETWPTGPTTLRLPPTGSLRIAFEATEGLIVPEVVRYRLFNLTDRTAPRPAPVWSRARPFVMPHVGLGLDIGIEVWGAVKGRTQTTSPSEAGSVVSVHVVLGEGGLVLKGRLLDETGQPLASRPFEACPREMSGSGGSGSKRRLRTDKDGRFVFPTPRKRPSATIWACEFRVERPGLPALTYTYSPDTPPRSGRIDLGDLRLSPPTVLASGRVLDPRGAPIAGARILVQAKGTKKAEARLSVADRIEPIAATDARGRFEIRGNLKQTEILLAARHAEFKGPDALWVRIPAEDVVVRMTPKTSLAGRVRLAPEVPTGGIEVVATELGAPGFRAISVGIDESGRYRFANLAPGRHRLLVRAPGLSKPLASREILMVAESTPEPVEFDLQGRVHGTTVSVTNQKGEMLHAIVDASPNKVDPSELHDGKDRSPYSANEADEVWHPNRACVIYHLARTVDLEVRCEGFEPEIRHGVSGAQTFRLRETR